MKDSQVYLKCKDHTVSNETFQLFYDEKYDMLITSPQPSLDKLPNYYKSEAYISHTDGNRSLFEKTYRFVKKHSLKQKLGYVNTVNPNKGMMLDIGAGTGDFLVTAQKDGWEAVGIEPNEQARAIALHKGVNIQETINHQPETFNAITMWHVLEHVPNLQEQIQQLYTLLKSDGTIFIAVPNHRSFDAKHYKEFWAAYDVPRHLWHFSKTSIERLFLEHNLKVVKILPMKFDSFYVSLLSEKYKTGRMNPFSAFLTGFMSNLKARRTGEYSSLIYIIKKTK